MYQLNVANAFVGFDTPSATQPKPQTVLTHAAAYQPFKPKEILRSRWSLRMTWD